MCRRCSADQLHRAACCGPGRSASGPAALGSPRAGPAGRMCRLPSRQPACCRAPQEAGAARAELCAGHRQAGHAAAAERRACLWLPQGRVSARCPSAATLLLLLLLLPPPVMASIAPWGCCRAGRRACGTATRAPPMPSSRQASPSTPSWSGGWACPGLGSLQQGLPWAGQIAAGPAGRCCGALLARQQLQRTAPLPTPLTDSTSPR